MFHQVLKERMIVAYDLAVAFMYLHENRLVYRDIKPEVRMSLSLLFYAFKRLAEAELTLVWFHRILVLMFAGT